MIRWLILAATCALLSGCGGGGGGGGGTPIPPVRTDLLFCYFGIVGKQIEETSDHINAIQCPDWGNWDDPNDRARIADAIIANLQEAKGRGVNKAIVCCGFLTFTAGYSYVGTAALTAYRTRLESLGLADMVVALYPLDEPDVLGVSDAVMTQAYNEIHAAWPVKLAVIYGDHGTPGKAAADWIGHDAYGEGAAVLNHMPTIRPDQGWIVVPGGANPWLTQPQPFADFANATPAVVMCMPFCWFDDYGGWNHSGIRSNGMAPQYVAVGRAMSGKAV